MCLPAGGQDHFPARSGILGGIGPVVPGSGLVPFRRYRDGTGFRDWVRNACDAAFEDAVIEASETDFLSMQLSSGPLLVDDDGLAGQPVVRVGAGVAAAGHCPPTFRADLLVRAALRLPHRAGSPRRRAADLTPSTERPGIGERLRVIVDRVDQIRGSIAEELASVTSRGKLA